MDLGSSPTSESSTGAAISTDSELERTHNDDDLPNGWEKHEGDLGTLLRFSTAFGHFCFVTSPCEGSPRSSAVTLSVSMRILIDRFRLTSFVFEMK